ncbi:AAA family ATPase [Streptomyces sp. CA-243310]|uniref:AAA family ATPase n=1 Tax=Streptomyces sp. CA-243310 TaxID=3240056 RepID=UPI003D908DB3
MLAQIPSIRPSTVAGPVAALVDVPTPLVPTETAPAPGGLGRLVGRSAEMAALRRAVEPALGDGTAVVLLEGEPGAGKSRLLEEIARHAQGRGALVVRGHCHEGEGTPTMWPWVETLTSLLDDMPPARRQEWRARDLGHLIGFHEPGHRGAGHMGREHPVPSVRAGRRGDRGGGGPPGPWS